MRLWLTSALVPLALTGCLAHERPDSADAGAVGVDASNAASDASLVVVHDTSSDGFGFDAGACAPSDLSIGIRVEPITMDAARCMTSHVAGASLTGIATAPADDGIRLHFDFCPNADADCRCDVVVTNVGTDIASTLSPNTNVTIDLQPGEGFFPGAFLSITKIPTCQCDGCGCSEPLYLYAANAPPDFARAVPVPMTFSRGALVCAPSDCTFGGTWRLHARGDAGEADVAGGTTRDLGSVHVRSVRDVEVFGPCAACAGCDTPIGAWVAWVSS